MTVDFSKLVLSAQNLPTLPNVAVEVLRLARSEDVSVDALAKVVQNDPALSGKILKVVNSSMFGLPRSVGSIKQAMVILGLRTVKVMALSFSLVEAFRARDGGGFDLELYWRPALTSAITSRMLAKSTQPMLTEEAFVVGLLSDIGMFAAWRAPDVYLPVLSAAHSQGVQLHEMEQQQLGVSHAAIGADLLRAWNLPDIVHKSVRCHHGEGIEQLDGPALRMAQIGYSAALISAIFCGDLPQSDLPGVREAIIEATGVTSEALEEIFGAIDGYVRETAKLLSLDIGKTTSYAQLQNDATTALAEMSVQAEMGREAATRRAEEASAESKRLADERKAILEVAATDALTKLANRAAFDTRLNEEIERNRRNQREMGLILLDVDHFKKFNDAHGHRAGDEVLRCVGECLRDVASHAGLVARYGGEEFATIVTGAAVAQIRELAEQIRVAIESRTVVFEGKQMRVTASLGAVKTRPADDTTPAAMIEQADQNLYAAKRSGRNRVEFDGP